MDSFLEFLLYLQGPIPYIAALVVLLICGLGAPIPEDITLFAMGILSYYGLTDLKLSILVCLFGVLAGDCIIYFIGKKYGVKLLEKPFFARHFTAERMEKTKSLFHKWGNRVILAARFMPGLRAPTYFTAGVLNLPFRVFIFYDGLASLASVPLLVGVTYYFGDQVDKVVRIAHRVQHGIVFLIAGLVLLLVAKAYFMGRAKKTKASASSPE